MIAAVPHLSQESRYAHLSCLLLIGKGKGVSLLCFLLRAFCLLCCTSCLASCGSAQCSSTRWQQWSSTEWAVTEALLTTLRRRQHVVAAQQHSVAIAGQH